MTETATIIGLDPTSGPLAREGDQQEAARPPCLDGAVVGLVANGLGEAERLLQALFEEIASSVEVAGAVPGVSGMPDYEFVTVGYPHVPLAIWTAEEIREVARELAPHVVARLVKS